MAKAPQSDSASAAPNAPAKVKVGRQAAKLVPLEKRLDKLRQEEAKRRRQLDKVAARSERTKSEMSEVIASVNQWVQNPEAQK